MDQSDHRRFDAALAKLLFTTNGQQRLPPNIAGAYWSVLKVHKWEVIAAAMTRALADQVGHVSPAKLAELCRPDAAANQAAADKIRDERHRAALAKADVAAELGGVKRFGSIWNDAEFQAAKDVANMEYARRCNGSQPGGFRFPTVDVKGYDGKFDYMMVVNAAELPKGKNPNKHAKAWETFWRLFREEFELYVKNQQVTGKPPEAL